MYLNKNKIFDEFPIPWPEYKDGNKENSINISINFFKNLFSKFTKICLYTFKELDFFNFSEEEVLSGHFHYTLEKNPQLKIFLSLFESARYNTETYLNISEFISFEYGFIIVERNLRNSIESLYDLYIILAECLVFKKSPLDTYYYNLLLFSSKDYNDNNDIESFKINFNNFKDNYIYKSVKNIYLSILKKDFTIISASNKLKIIKKYLFSNFNILTDFNSYFKKTYKYNGEEKSFIDIIHNKYYKNFNASIHPNIFNDFFFNNSGLGFNDFFKNNIDYPSEKNITYLNKTESTLYDLFYFNCKILLIAINLISIYYFKSTKFDLEDRFDLSFTISYIEDYLYFDDSKNNKFIEFDYIKLLDTLPNSFDEKYKNILLKNKFDLRSIDRLSSQIIVDSAVFQRTNYYLCNYLDENNITKDELSTSIGINIDNAKYTDILNFLEIEKITMKINYTYITLYCTKNNISDILSFSSPENLDNSLSWIKK